MKEVEFVVTSYGAYKCSECSEEYMEPRVAFIHAYDLHDATSTTVKGGRKV